MASRFGAAADVLKPVVQPPRLPASVARPLRAEPAPLAGLRGSERDTSFSASAASFTKVAVPALGALALNKAVGGRSRQQRDRRRRILAARASGDSTGKSQDYLNITGFPFPLGPLFARRTVRTQVDDGIWTFEQEQSLANIAVNVRMTAILLESGELWIHNPVAPTEECEALVRELGYPVKYIVLGSAQYEHKIFVGPFARRFPDAKTYIVPQQWSFPIDLPSPLLGIFAEGELVDRDTSTPWGGEIEQRLLCPKDRLGLGYSAAECAFFHRRTKTLICTDALVFVPPTPPAVLDRSELINLGRSNDNIVLDLVAATNWRGSGDVVREQKKYEADNGEPTEQQLLERGWKRDALLALFFGPDGKSVVDPSQAFDAIMGKWIVGPVCYSLVYGGKIRKDVRDWADALCEWDFQQILPCHFAGPVRGNRGDVQRAFQVLQDEVDATAEPEGGLPWPFPQPITYRADDIKLLTDLRGILTALKVI